MHFIYFLSLTVHPSSRIAMHALDSTPQSFLFFTTFSLKM